MNLKLGKNMKDALNFVKKNKGWHSFNKKCRATVNAIKSLQRRGLVNVNEFNQYSLK